MGREINEQKTGVGEWAEHKANCISGCTHRCRYCYAAHNALRFKRIKDREEWGTTYLHVREKDVRKGRKKLDGRIMFPTSHDLEPQLYDAWVRVLRKLLYAGNEVLIVSKPHLSSIRAIVATCTDFRDQILFRFSIGAIDDDILNYWEPGAPSFDERFQCLAHAYHEGFATSVSCEPLLEHPGAETMVEVFAPYVTETIWFGKMNHIRKRVAPGTCEHAIAAIEAGQTDEAVLSLYESLKDEPKVRWKDSYTEVLRRHGIDV